MKQTVQIEIPDTQAIYFCTCRSCNEMHNFSISYQCNDLFYKHRSLLYDFFVLLFFEIWNLCRRASNTQEIQYVHLMEMVQRLMIRMKTKKFPVGITGSDYFKQGRGHCSPSSIALQDLPGVIFLVDLTFGISLF